MYHGTIQLQSAQQILTCLFPSTQNFCFHFSGEETKAEREMVPHQSTWKWKESSSGRERWSFRWWSISAATEMSNFDCGTAACLNQSWYFRGAQIVQGLCKTILKVSVFNSYTKSTLFIQRYWPNTAKKTPHKQRHNNWLRVTTSKAKTLSRWKRRNALNSWNKTVLLNVCNSGQSNLPMCSKTPPKEKKITSLLEGMGGC